jgi:hypothetical protein
VALVLPTAVGCESRRSEAVERSVLLPLLVGIESWPQAAGMMTTATVKVATKHDFATARGRLK